MSGKIECKAGSVYNVESEAVSCAASLNQQAATNQDASIYLLATRGDEYSDRSQWVIQSTDQCKVGSAFLNQQDSNRCVDALKAKFPRSVFTTLQNFRSQWVINEATVSEP